MTNRIEKLKTRIETLQGYFRVLEQYKGSNQYTFDVLNLQLKVQIELWKYVDELALLNKQDEEVPTAKPKVKAKGKAADAEEAVNDETSNNN